jgi:hypothetical protein
MTDEKAVERLVAAVTDLQDIAAAVTPEEAARAFDEASLELFWRDWPEVTSWTEALWRRVDEDRADPAREAADPELDEVGGGD